MSIVFYDTLPIFRFGMDIFLHRHGTEVFRVAVLIWGLRVFSQGCPCASEIYISFTKPFIANPTPLPCPPASPFAVFVVVLPPVHRPLHHTHPSRSISPSWLLRSAASSRSTPMPSAVPLPCASSANAPTAGTSSAAQCVTLFGTLA